MNTTVRLQTFTCPFLHSSISRASCAARHAFYASKGGASADSVTGCVCRTCPIGQQHSKGKAADVALVHVEPRIEPARKAPRSCIVCAEPVGSGAPSGHGRGRSRFLCGRPSCRDFAAFEHQDDMLVEWA